MSTRWAALINLPPHRHERLETILSALAIEPQPLDWEQVESRDFAGQVQVNPPVLLVATEEDYGRRITEVPSIRPREGGPTIALLAPATLTPEGLRAQLHYNVLNMFPDVMWDHDACLERTIRGMLFPPEMFEIRRYLPEAAVVKRAVISNLAEKHEVADEVSALAKGFAAVQDHVRDIRLIITELINNAFFHSFVNLEGEQKYSPRRFSRLDGEDRVVLEAALADGAVALGIEDNRGTLNPREVLKYLLRQVSGAGMYDSHGRGFYLVTNLVDHLSVSLVPGRRARVVAMSHAGTTPQIRTLNFFVSNQAE